MPKEKTLNYDLFYEGSSASLPRLHTCEIKVPFWDFKEFAVTLPIKDLWKTFSKIWKKKKNENKKWIEK